MMAQSTKKNILPSTKHLLRIIRECSKENRKVPPRIVHYIEFALECKMHKMGSPLYYSSRNTRQVQKDPQEARKTMGVETISWKGIGQLATKPM